MVTDLLVRAKVSVRQRMSRYMGDLVDKRPTERRNRIALPGTRDPANMLLSCLPCWTVVLDVP